MTHIFFMYWIIILCTINNCVTNYETFISHDTCNDELCLIKNNSQLEKTDKSKPIVKISNFNFANNSKYINESEIYFVAVTEESLGVNINNFTQKHKKYEFQNDIKLRHFFENTEKQNPTGFHNEELSNATDITEITEITTQGLLSSTFEPNLTENISTSDVKIMLPTTQPSYIKSQFFSSKNYKRNKTICFCDMEVNKCDINCCCDEDCTLSHFKVFTKCSGDNDMIDTRYCYKNNFIFGNNTSQEKILSHEGLFCIVKENLKLDFMYQTKPVLKTLEAFNKSLPNNFYAFSYKSSEKLNLINENYVFGSPIWSVQKGELIPFKIPHSSVGFLCNSEMNIKYLIDQFKKCFYQQNLKTDCKGSKIRDVLQHLKDIKIISSHNFFNKSKSVKSLEICETKACIGITSYLCQSFNSTTNCTKISDDFSQLSCWNALSRIQYQIWHNGSNGITKMEAYLWVKKLPKISNEFLLQLTIEVKFMWVGFSKIEFKRSGNPGYLTGKPILAGRKIYNVVNDTSKKKEAIQLSNDPKDWLSVLGSEKGICSFERRVSVSFRENSQNMCSLKLNKNNFSKEKCIELQINIFKLLVGNDIINESKAHFFNKFVATFGNSKVEETGDWVQVLIDLFPIISSQVSFKSSHYYLTCKNIITDLYINIVYSNIGSFLAPQAKILGVAFHFGKHKDLSFFCDTPSCRNTSSIQYFKLSSIVHFFDISESAIDAFAEPISLEAKLPHDFFYPFFSKSSKFEIFNEIIVVLFCVTLFSYFVSHGVIF